MVRFVFLAGELLSELSHTGAPTKSFDRGLLVVSPTQLGVCGPKRGAFSILNKLQCEARSDVPSSRLWLSTIERRNSLADHCAEVRVFS